MLSDLSLAKGFLTSLINYKFIKLFTYKFSQVNIYYLYILV